MIHPIDARVKILRGPYAGTAGRVTAQLPGRHYTVDNGFGGVDYHHDDLEAAPDKKLNIKGIVEEVVNLADYRVAKAKTAPKQLDGEGLEDMLHDFSTYHRVQDTNSHHLISLHLPNGEDDDHDPDLEHHHRLARWLQHRGVNAQVGAVLDMDGNHKHHIVAVPRTS